jgi:hypothetical protein
MEYVNNRQKMIFENMIDILTKYERRHEYFSFIEQLKNKKRAEQ